MQNEKKFKIDKTLIIRIIVYVLGIFILAFGTVMFTRCGLGVSAVVAVPFVVSLISPLSLGTCVSIIYAIFVIVELIIYRKIKLKVILQFPFSFVFGFVIDFYNDTVGLSNVNPSNIGIQIVFLIIAIITTAVGIVMMVHCNFIVNPPDGLVQAVASRSKKDFGTLKFFVDLTLIILSAILGLIFEHAIVGLGIGTVIAVFTIGNLIRFIDKKILPKLQGSLKKAISE